MSTTDGCFDLNSSIHSASAGPSRDVSVEGAGLMAMLQMGGVVSSNTYRASAEGSKNQQQQQHQHQQQHQEQEQQEQRLTTQQLYMAHAAHQRGGNTERLPSSSSSPPPPPPPSTIAPPLSDNGTAVSSSRIGSLKHVMPPVMSPMALTPNTGDHTVKSAGVSRRREVPYFRSHNADNDELNANKKEAVATGAPNAVRRTSETAHYRQQQQHHRPPSKPFQMNNISSSTAHDDDDDDDGDEGAGGEDGMGMDTSDEVHVAIAMLNHRHDTYNNKNMNTNDNNDSKDTHHRRQIGGANFADPSYLAGEAEAKMKSKQQKVGSTQNAMAAAAEEEEEVVAMSGRQQQQQVPTNKEGRAGDAAPLIASPSTAPPSLPPYAPLALPEGLYPPIPHTMLVHELSDRRRLLTNITTLSTHIQRLQIKMALYEEAAAGEEGGEGEGGDGNGPSQRMQQQQPSRYPMPPLPEHIVASFDPIIADAHINRLNDQLAQLSLLREADKTRCRAAEDRIDALEKENRLLKDKAAYFEQQSSNADRAMHAMRALQQQSDVWEDEVKRLRTAEALLMRQVVQLKREVVEDGIRVIDERHRIKDMSQTEARAAAAAAAAAGIAPMPTQQHGGDTAASDDEGRDDDALRVARVFLEMDEQASRQDMLIACLYEPLAMAMDAGLVWLQQAAAISEQQQQQRSRLQRRDGINNHSHHDTCGHNPSPDASSIVNASALYGGALVNVSGGVGAGGEVEVLRHRVLFLESQVDRLTRAVARERQCTEVAAAQHRERIEAITLSRAKDRQLMLDAMLPEVEARLRQAFKEGQASGRARAVDELKAMQQQQQRISANGERLPATDHVAIEQTTLPLGLANPLSVKRYRKTRRSAPTGAHSPPPSGNTNAIADRAKSPHNGVHEHHDDGANSSKWLLDTESTSHRTDANLRNAADSTSHHHDANTTGTSTVNINVSPNASGSSFANNTRNNPTATAAAAGNNPIRSTSASVRTASSSVTTIADNNSAAAINAARPHISVRTPPTAAKPLASASAAAAFPSPMLPPSAALMGGKGGCCVVPSLSAALSPQLSSQLSTAVKFHTVVDGCTTAESLVGLANQQSKCRGEVNACDGVNAVVRNAHNDADGAEHLMPRRLEMQH